MGEVGWPVMYNARVSLVPSHIFKFLEFTQCYSTSDWICWGHNCVVSY